MKNRMPIICVLICILLLVIIITGCGEGFRRDTNKKPDDDISEAIYNAVGKKKVYYQGMDSNNPDEIVVYEYLVHDYEAESVLSDMVEAANAVMKEKETAEKKDMDLREKIPGGTEAVVSLRTYYEDEEGYEQYDFFKPFISMELNTRLDKARAHMINCQPTSPCRTSKA